MSGFLIIVIVLGLVWLFLVVPIRRRQRSHADAHSAMQDSLSIGDEIITAGGLHAVVRELGDEELRIEIAPGVVATLDRRAVAAVAEEIDVEIDPEIEPEEHESLKEPAPGPDVKPR